MEKEQKKYAPLPSNYVSLVQLQERWLKQQQQKQREKEEQSRPREKLGQEQNRQDEEIRRPNQNGERTEASSVTVIIRPPYLRNGRKQSQRNRQAIEVSKPKLDESAVEGVDQEQKADESKIIKKKKKKKTKRKNGKPRAEEDQTIGIFRSLAPEADPEEEIPVVVAERNGEKERIRSKFPQNGSNRGLSRKVWEQKVPGYQTAEIERSLEGLSLNGGKEARESSTAEMNGGQWRHGGSGRFDCREVCKQKACNLVWVKKSEISAAICAEIRSSGPLVKTREDKKKNQRKLKQKEIKRRE